MRNTRKKLPKVMIEGSAYVAATQIVEVLGISRQTLWRWRQDGHIPAGAKYRDRVLVFTEKEAEQIRDFAHRVVPLREADARERGRSRA